MERFLAVSTVLALALAPFGEAPAADFAFGFAGCPEGIMGMPGEEKTFELFGTLTTSSNVEPDGAQAWSASVSITGGVISAISIQGLFVPTIYCKDEDRDPCTPCVLHDPYDQHLGAQDMFTRVAALAPVAVQTGCPPPLPAGEEPLPAGAQGAISAVVFKGGSGGKQVLQPLGTVKIFKLTIKATIPQSPACSSLTLKYRDCLRSTQSQPVRNIVTFLSKSRMAALGECTVQLCRPTSSFRRGDANGSGRVDISDAVAMVTWMFLRGAEPSCLDAADADDDGENRLTDPIYLLSWLFDAGRPLPAPGPEACGADPVGDTLKDCAYDPTKC